MKLLFIIKGRHSRLGLARMEVHAHNPSDYLVGDEVSCEAFEGLGFVKINSRRHLPEGNMLFLFCSGPIRLQQMLVDKYPNIEGERDSAQLPLQFWG